MSVTPEDFALEDYKQKISYLTAHFTRMWTRFNYFVAIETGLLGGKFLVPNNMSSRALGIAGVVISAVWYVMGAEDRYLVRLYRFQVKEAAEKLGQIIWHAETAQKAYRHVGEISHDACRDTCKTLNAKMKMGTPGLLVRGSWKGSPACYYLVSSPNTVSGSKRRILLV